MKNIRSIVLLCGIVLLSSCQAAQKSIVKPQNNSSTDTIEIIRNVIRQKAIPGLLENGYLAKPTLIISGRIAESTSIDGKIDELSKMIRHAVVLELLSHPGIALVQRHRLQQYRTAGQIQRLNCRNNNQPEYYLLIDTRAGNNKIFVDMAVLDADENRIQSGTGASFDFVKTTAMAELMKKKGWDEYLVGTKRLPISQNDQDAVAAYLGYSMVCVLQNIYIPRNSGVFIDRTGLSTYDEGIMDFLENYLITYGLPVIQNRANATHILEPNVGASGDVYIFWTRIKDEQTDQIVPYSSTRVYYKKPEEVLSLNIRRLQNSNCCIEVRSHLGVPVQNFSIMENGRQIFPNVYCPSKNYNYRINNDTATLDFSSTGSIFLGGENDTFSFDLPESGKITVNHSIKNQHYRFIHKYNLSD